MYKIDKKGDFLDKKKDKDLEIQCLEDVVFNKPDKSNYKKRVLDENQESTGELSFIVDKIGDNELLNDKKSKKPVWQDEDDDLGFENVFTEKNKKPKKFGAENKYKEYLDYKFNSLNPIPKWATSKITQEDDTNISRTAGDILSRSLRLQSGELNYKHCVSINRYEQKKHHIVSVQFHSIEKVALLAYRKNLRLFNVDEKENKNICSVDFEDFGIVQAEFSVNGEEIYISNNLKPGRFFYFDILSNKPVKVPFYRGKEALEFRQFALSPDGRYIAACGSNNRIHLLDSKTKEIIADLKINSPTSNITFNKASSKLFTHSEEGKVYIFDLRNNNRCTHRFIDEGCINGSSIAISNNEQFVACGSDSGIVNIYNYNDVFKSLTPKPIKIFPHLVTSINKIKFNHNTEMMVITSNQIENSIKCVNLPSFKAYSNLPGLNAKYGNITDIDFSPNSYYLTLSNKQGNAKLIRLLYYENY